MLTCCEMCCTVACSVWRTLTDFLALDSAEQRRGGSRVVVGREKSPDLQTDSDSNMPAETVVKFKGMSREDMIEVVIRMEAVMEEKGKRIADMEDYLDSLLLR